MNAVFGRVPMPFPSGVPPLLPPLPCPGPFAARLFALRWRLQYQRISHPVKGSPVVNRSLCHHALFLSEASQVEKHVCTMSFRELDAWGLAPSRASSNASAARCSGSCLRRPVSQVVLGSCNKGGTTPLFRAWPTVRPLHACSDELVDAVVCS